MPDEAEYIEYLKDLFGEFLDLDEDGGNRKMKKLIITIDESKLKDPITEDEVKDTILDKIDDALDYGY